MQLVAIMRHGLVLRQSKHTLNRILSKHRIYSSNTSNTDSQPSIEPPNIQKLAQLAQIGITDEEAAEWGPKIAGIVDWFGQLQQVDLEGIEPSLRANVEDGNHLREDTPQDFNHREDMLRQVPEREGSFVKVPKTVVEN